MIQIRVGNNYVNDMKTIRREGVELTKRVFKVIIL